jgi:uncharacterized damage-inducible protein DinB
MKMTNPLPRFSVEPIADCDPEIGRWLAILDDARKRTRYTLKLPKPEDLDAAPIVGLNSIGTLLYHIALVDLDWIYTNMLQQPYPADVAALFPYPLQQKDERLYVMSGWDLEAYQQRLSAARAKVHEVFKAMSGAEFRGILRRVQDYGEYEMTPESVLQHLAQHEAEHRGELQILMDGLRA